MLTLLAIVFVIKVICIIIIIIYRRHKQRLGGQSERALQNKSPKIGV